ncbi:MAG TPA: hypothetical protein VF715_13090 [Thermoleophilaceae bacterium]|jgi:hypothetical protein
MDRFGLLDWLVDRERDGALAPTGLNLLEERQRAGGSWDETLQAANALLDADWISGQYFAPPGRSRPPRGVPLSAHEFQHLQAIHVTDRGYSVHRDRNPVAAGLTFNITNSQIGQLAAGDINNVTIENFFVELEHAIDQSNAPAVEKEEAKETVGKMRQLLAGAGGSAAGGLISSALRAVLGLP